MPRRQARAAAGPLLLSATLLACGSSEPPRALPADAASKMRAQLAAVRSAANAGDRAQATRALDAFAAAVSRERSAGNLPAAMSAKLEQAISRTRERIVAEVAAPAPVPPPAAVAPPPAAPPAARPPARGGKGASKGKDAGKSKGRGSR